MPGQSRIEPGLASFPEGGVWRVARSGSLENFSRIQPQDAPLPNSGNRFDVLGGGVLYAATKIEGCYAETLARFRPSPAVLAAIGNEAGYMNPGGVPADWREQRRKYLLRAERPLPFLDVEAPETHTFLTHELAAELAAIGVPTALDVPRLRDSNRLVTRLIAQWAYAATDENDLPIYSGIRYVSRLGDWECWAIFEETELELGTPMAIESTDPALRAIADKFNLVLH